MRRSILILLFLFCFLGCGQKSTQVAIGTETTNGVIATPLGKLKLEIKVEKTGDYQIRISNTKGITEVIIDGNGAAKYIVTFETGGYYSLEVYFINLSEIYKQSINIY